MIARAWRCLFGPTVVIVLDVFCPRISTTVIGRVADVVSIVLHRKYSAWCKTEGPVTPVSRQVNEWALCVDVRKTCGSRRSAGCRCILLETVALHSQGLHLRRTTSHCPVLARAC